MLRLHEIQDAFQKLVGWEQDYDPAQAIDAELCQTESGLTYQQAHPQVTLENIRNIMPMGFLGQHPYWSSLVSYAKDAKVNYKGKTYIALRANTGVEPGSQGAGDDWAVYNSLSDYLRKLTTDGINTMIQTFLTQKQISRETKSIVERRTLFDGAARLQSIIEPYGKIVGLEIVPVRAMGVTTKIERVGLQMIGANGTIKMYLFHSSRFNPVRVLEFEYTNSNGGFQWFTPTEEVYLPYIGDGINSGGAWFLCYAQDELPPLMRALNMTKDWSKEPCATCLGYSIESWRQITKYLQISPFSAATPDEFSEQPQMFDIGQLSYTNTQNYGINLEVSIGCDLTDFIISQRAIFANVLQKQVAAQALRTMAMNPDVRVNRNQMNVTRNELLYELDGAVEGRPMGLAHDLAQVYKALRIDTQGLDRICLQCNNNGVAYTHV